MHDIDVCGEDRLERVRAAVAGDGANERTLDVQPGDDPRRQRITFPQLYQPREPRAHRLHMLCDDGGEDAADAVSVEFLASRVQVVRREFILVEINAAVAVDLQVEVTHEHPVLPLSNDADKVSR